MSKKKPLTGIHLNWAIYDKGGKNITLEEREKFISDLLELVATRGWLAGGTTKKIDVNN